ncbi:hypothetical protein FHR24_003137 [Wenyingzhuangia heitensis]|uniref:AhpC/TSA family protein n=1 Tax=Wenyingzhuangia heitensis TaxID=1487859 RepID=A0ABX0UCT0_9FLAO|nr:hypothetical protein [Wenyingzhuangia heitensis]NIJ46642.1 hypothetical protein [Wenyingzhuangia heitensis]
MTIRISLLLLLLFFSCKEKNNNNLQSPTEIIKEANDVATISENYIIQNLKISDIKDDNFSLKELVGKKTKLIFRFSDRQCSYCVEHSLRYLKKVEKKIGVDNIIYIGDFIDKNSYSVFLRLYPNINQKIFSYNKRFYLKVDTLSLPYMFTLDNNLKAKNVFVPLKEVPQRTNKYIMKVKNEFNK